MARTRKGLSLDAALSLSPIFTQPPPVSLPLPPLPAKAIKNLMERTNKILERSRNVKKLKKPPRKKSPVKPGILEISRNCKKLKKPQRKKSPVKPRILPARASARLCVRKNSGEHEQCLMRSHIIPLRTVELIKRPLELREPATKLLYMASLSLYPTADPDSDTTPIVIISEEIPNSCGKKPKMRSMEVPLLPNWKRASFQPVSSSRALLEPLADNNSAVQSNKVMNSASVKQKPKSLETIIKDIPKMKSQSADKVNGNSSEVPLPASAELNLTSHSTQLPAVNPILEELMKNPVKNKKRSHKAKNQQPPPNNVVKSAPVKRKRKSLETIIKEIPKPKSEVADQVNGNSTEVQLPSLPVSELNLTSISTTLSSVNPILEGLMKIPVKKKRIYKPKTAQRPPESVAMSMSMSPINLQNPVSMIVPLQPAPGNSNLNATTTPLAKEQKGKQRNKKQKSQFQLPLPLPIPIPPGLLNYATVATLVPNNNLSANPTPPKPKRQRKPPKPKAPKVTTILGVPSLSLPQHQQKQPMPHHQLASIPYLPSHLEAYYHSSPAPVGIAGNGVKESCIMSSIYHYNQDQHQPMDLDQALDLCVKAQPIVQPAKTKKSKAPAMKSLLKPMNIEEDGPLNLVMARGGILPGGPTTAVAKKPEQKMSTSPSTMENMKQQGNLENVKQMLARLHTKIAPVVNGVQLITIE